jgi:hypothetical protein
VTRRRHVIVRGSTRVRIVHVSSWHPLWWCSWAMTRARRLWMWLRLWLLLAINALDRM